MTDNDDMTQRLQLTLIDVFECGIQRGEDEEELTGDRYT